jgi:hypothetical protein
MSHKFLNLIESTIQKMTNGGILVGDRVSLVSGYKSKDSFKGLSDDVQKYIEDMFTGNDLNKKVINIKTDNGSRAPANADNRADSFFVDVAVELTNGLYDNQNAVTVPSDILKVEEEDISFGSPVPDSVKYDNKVQIDPVKPEENEEQQQTMTQQGDSLKKTNLSNASKNTKIPSKSATPSPAVNESYTSQYMPING